MNEVTVTDAALREAASKGSDEFLALVIDAICASVNNELTAETMAQLNADQITLYGFKILHEEVMDGGFVQLIHNGYGPFIFLNPFAKALRLWGLHDLSKLVYKGRKLFEQDVKELTRECSDEEFMALFEQFPHYDDLDDEFVENEESYVDGVAYYVDEHLANFVIDQYTAGIVLTGTEIKSIRAGKAGLVDTFCFISNNEIWVKNMYIAEYSFGSFNRHEIRRDRKLLLNKKEIRNLAEETKSPGQTIVPLRLFIDDNGRAKLVIGLCRGKKEYDKRETLKEKEGRREMDRVLKGHRYGA